MIRKKFPTQWKRFQSSRIITLIVNWVQRFQSELTAKFTIEFFFQRHILFYLHSKSPLIPVTTIGDFFWLIPPSSLAWGLLGSHFWQLSGHFWLHLVFGRSLLATVRSIWPLEGYFGLLRAHLGPLGCHFQPQGSHFGPQESHFGPQGGHLGPHRGYLKPKVCYLQSQASHFGSYGDHLGPKGRSLGIWERSMGIISR